jgi:hypothetical protein
MIFGNPQNVALEISIEQTRGLWVYGTFSLWLGGHPLGNGEDHGVHLNGCTNWLSDFIDSPKDRCAPGLMEEPKGSV